jgi:hypothetical protein
MFFASGVSATNFMFLALAADAAFGEESSQ